METLPFGVSAVFACLHPEQFRAMLGMGPKKPDFSLRLEKPGPENTASFLTKLAEACPSSPLIAADQRNRVLFYFAWAAFGE